MLSDMLQNPQLLSHFHTYDLKLKSNSAIPILSIRRHRVSNVIATATNPRQIGFTDRDFGHTDSFYPAAPSSNVIAIAKNPRQIGLTDRDLGLTEMGL